MDFNLPKSEITQTGDFENEITISISKNAEYFLNGKSIQKEKLYSYIKTELKPSLKPTIILELDTASRFGDFFEITSLLKAQSINNVQLATKQN